MLKARPNILWILSDQHNAQAMTGPSDGLVETPHLDGLAERGTTFTNAFCQGPLCMPSRASLLHQAYVRDHGVETNAVDGSPFPLPTVIQRVREAGYHTAALGKMHFFKYPADVDDLGERMRGLGFDEVLEMHGKYGNADGRSTYTDYLRDRGELDDYRSFLLDLNPMTRGGGAPGTERPAHWSARSAPLADDSHPDSWLGRVASQWVADYDGDQPFFAIIGFSGPHDPWDAPDSYLERYATKSIPLPADRGRPTSSDARFQRLIDYVASYGDSDTMSAADLVELRRRYYAGVTFLDDQIGEVLRALSARSDRENTVVIYTSDHGELLGEHGLVTKSLFYDAATRVPLVISAPGGTAGAIYDDLVELTDLSATIIDLSGAEPIGGAPGTSLGSVVYGSQEPVRRIVRSESHGFGMWRSHTRKLVVDETNGEVVQVFDLAADPGESVNLVSEAQDAESSWLRREAMADLDARAY